MIEALQSILIYGGSFIAVLSLVVFVHEFGHFQAARWRGVAIDTFSIGFGKTLLSWRDRQGVNWKIGALPLGGYVKFADDANSMSTAAAEPIEDPVQKAEARKKGLFHAQTLSTRSIVVAAGPVANFIFSILTFAVLAMIVGRDVTDPARLVARIDGVQAGSAAAEAGLLPGDVVLEVNGQTISSFSQFQSMVEASPGQPLQLTLRRADEVTSLSATPGSREVADEGGAPTQRGFLGIVRQMRPEERVIEPVGPISAIGLGATQTWNMVAQTGAYVGGMLTGRNSGADIAGPLGILSASGQIAESALAPPDQGVLDKVGTLALSLIGWAAMLSVAVGIVNLLPIPILDGGHLLFYAIEAVRGGRPLPLAAQEWAFRAGLAVMASLFLFATWNDVTRHLTGTQG